MKLALIADPHVGYTSLGFDNPVTGINTHIEDTIACLSEMVERSITERVDRFFIIGDVFRNRYPTKQCEWLFANQMGKLIRAGIRIEIVLGNHDFYKAVSSLAILEGLRIDSHINIYTEPTLLNLGDGSEGVAILPWWNSPEPVDSVEYTQHISEVLDSMSNPPLILGHLPLTCAWVGEYQLSGLEPGVQDTGIFRQSRVFLGHYHKAQEIGPNISYIGSLNVCDISERDEPKRGIIYDTETDTFESVWLRRTRAVVVQSTIASLDMSFGIAAGALVDAIVDVHLTGGRLTRYEVASILKPYGVRHLRNLKCTEDVIETDESPIESEDKIGEWVRTNVPESDRDPVVSIAQEILKAVPE